MVYTEHRKMKLNRVSAGKKKMNTIYLVLKFVSMHLYDGMARSLILTAFKETKQMATGKFPQ